ASDDCLDDSRAHHLAEQSFLVWKVEIYGALGDSCLFGDVFEACSGKAVLPEHIERGVEYLLWAFFRKPPPARLRNFCGHKRLKYVTDQSVTYSRGATASTSSGAATRGFCAADPENGFPLLRPDRLHREPATLPEQLHLLQLADVPQAREVEEILESVAGTDIYHVPDRIRLTAFGIIMFVRWFPGGIIRVALTHDLCRSYYPGWVGAGVVEQHPVPFLHVVAHEVARLIVAHAAPVGRLARRIQQVVVREAGWLTLEQPVATGFGLGHWYVPLLVRRSGIACLPEIYGLR